ncbi:MAG: methyltransferase [Rhodospirillales bacterium]|jgi:hypothetical protein|nr:methyltransferase [Rhodospirillales bacterium]MBT4040583.1 methyltransferase [Rhodospirillales bacterium]MBT4627028.1 methyltransferase [Rhodospirillales bacterium]MBT5352213.1 methyltransferase [Rhodospirillales bacterium]MBT5520118.1 methyltransferase [Rhodospirillales bacterium]
MTKPIKTELGYLIPTREKPIYVASEAGAGAQLDISAKFKPHPVTIHDARDINPAPTLDREGFALLDHDSAVTDFYDDAQVRDVYEQEAADLVKQVSGASHVVVFDNTRRSDAQSIRGERNTREPSTVIHNDYTDASARQRLRDILPSGEAEDRLQHRFAIINVWRSIAGPVLTTPMALCAATSFRERDLIAGERRAKDRIGELQLVTHNPDHQWYWYSAMTADEAMLIKTYDSATDGRARRSIHTAFVNPRAPAGSPPRESMETRTLAFFDDGS